MYINVFTHSYNNSQVPKIKLTYSSVKHNTKSSSKPNVIILQDTVRQLSCTETTQ